MSSHPLLMCFKQVKSLCHCVQQVQLSATSRCMRSTRAAPAITGTHVSRDDSRGGCPKLEIWCESSNLQTWPKSESCFKGKICCAIEHGTALPCIMTTKVQNSTCVCIPREPEQCQLVILQVRFRCKWGRLCHTQFPASSLLHCDALGLPAVEQLRSYQPGLSCHWRRTKGRLCGAVRTPLG